MIVPSPAEPPPAVPGPIVAGRYEIVRALGHGAFGRTLLARDRERAGCEVALKLFDVRGAPDLKALELFEREADVLRALRHHGVPEV
jgi:serine/threonine protein kinase